MAKFINKSASDFPVPTLKINSNSSLTRVPDIYTPHLQRASGPQAPTPPAMTDIRRTRLQMKRLQILSAKLDESNSTKEACDIFTNELGVMAKNIGDVATILSLINHHYKADTPIRRHAQGESINLYNGQWTAFFRNIAVNAQWLTNHWGGSLWLPTDIRATAEGCFGNSEPSLYVLMLVDITKAAQAKGMNLRSLWANNGDIRVAMRNNASQYLTLELVNGVIQSINGARVEKTLNVPENGPQDRSAINPANGTEKANSDRVDINHSNETKPIAQDPNSEAPLANTVHCLPKTLDHSASQSNVTPERPQPSPLAKCAQAATPPTGRKRTFDEMNCQELSAYSQYEELFTNLNPSYITKLRDEALKSLEQAESDKATIDCALTDLKVRGDLFKEVRDHSKALVDEMSDGMRGQSNQGVLAGVLASTRTAYVNGITSLLDSVFQASSNSQGKPTAKDLQARQAEAVDKVCKAKERVQALNHIEKAWSIHQLYQEAKRYRQKQCDLLSETDERTIELKKACLSTFSQAEQED